MHPDFNPPIKDPRITSRKTTLTGLFFVTLTPLVLPTDEEVDEALGILGMKAGQCVCAYCGGTKSEWDHFRPIVLKRRPTGYITEIANLVPSCGKCNQSKGNAHWRKWMLSPTAKHSPTSRKIPDINKRMSRLERFEAWRTPIQIDYETVFGPEKWAQHMKYLDDVLELLSQAESNAEHLRKLVESHLKK
jgi:hypothetical protein